MSDSVWLFAYGSLIYKVDFPYLECRPAQVRHWVRRFWHGSHDHRGTPDNPGRVATLYPMQGGYCAGLAYRVTAQTLDTIDVREKNGYQRQSIALELTDGSQITAIAYVADRHHSAFLGPACLDVIADQIARCKGESGTNQDYLQQLALSLERLSINDMHVRSLLRRLAMIDIG